MAFPSASVLNEIRNKNSHRPAPENFLAVLADPVFSSSDPRVHALPGGEQSVQPDTHELDTPDGEDLKRATRDVAQNRNGGVLPQLWYSREEAERIVRNLLSSVDRFVFIAQYCADTWLEYHGSEHLRPNRGAPRKVPHFGCRLFLQCPTNS